MKVKDEQHGLYNVLGITSEDGKQAIYVPGNSGALILSVPTNNETFPREEVPSLLVYGMVLGRYTYRNYPEIPDSEQRSMTIANRLYEVLQRIYGGSTMHFTNHWECKIYSLFQQRNCELN